VEIQPHDFDEQKLANPALINLAAEHGKPVVVTKDSHYPWPEWADTQDVSLMMRTRQTFEDREKKRAAGDDVFEFSTQTAYIGSEDDTRALFAAHHPDIPASIVESALANTGEIAARCVPFLLDRTPKLPKFTPDPERSYAQLRALVAEGLAALGHGNDPAYTEQAERELEIFRQRKICDFFLITWDFVRWARSSEPLPGETGAKQPIPVGVGRGSAGGSVVAYALRITSFNPIAYELKFERFLNPHREGLPDIDLDFPPGPEGVELVQEYVKRKWGADKVYDMIAHGTLQARGVLSRLGTVYGIPISERVAVTKTIDEKQVREPLELLRESNVDLDRFASRHPDLWKHAVRLQGNVGSIGEHAAGVVISDKPLDQLIPVMKKAAGDDYMVTAFGEAADSKLISSLGLLKVDFLVVDELAKHLYAVELIKRYRDEDIDLDALPVLEDPLAADPATMANFQRGLNLGVYQFGGSAPMISLTKRVAPENIRHLAAVNALIRPGASRGIDDYVKARHNPTGAEYWDPSVYESLKSTYGICTYQEQVMDVMQRLGGFDPARADDVRRIMSKEYRKGAAQARKALGVHMDDFVSNAAGVVQGGRPKAEEIWDSLGYFSLYAFNLSHAAAYALMGYMDMWLKTHYPEAFYAALLTFPPAYIKKAEQRKPFYEKVVREAQAFGIRILPPDINESDAGFTITGDGLRFGLTAIKGLGKASVSDVLNGRPFTDWDDLVARTTKCSAAGRSALGAAGALDCWGARDTMTEEERLRAEEDRLGIALTAPDKIGALRRPLERILHSQADFEQARDGDLLVVGGELLGGKEYTTRIGPAVNLTFAFGADEYRVNVPPWEWEKPELKALLDRDEPIVIRGTKDGSYSSLSMIEMKLAEEVCGMVTA
jgi:DNA polymerase-3 subunit alpha